MHCNRELPLKLAPFNLNSIQEDWEYQTVLNFPNLVNQFHPHYLYHTQELWLAVQYNKALAEPARFYKQEKIYVNQQNVFLENLCVKFQ